MLCRAALSLQAATSEHLGKYALLDISLDPFPYTGTTTTCESLLQGVPCLTLSGRCHAHNVSKSLLTAVGLADAWVAESTERYVQLAVQHASDLPRLAQLRSGLRQQLLASPLCDAPRFVRQLEAAYRQMWCSYVDGGGQPAGGAGAAEAAGTALPAAAAGHGHGCHVAGPPGSSHHPHCQREADEEDTTEREGFDAEDGPEGDQVCACLATGVAGIAVSGGAAATSGAGGAAEPPADSTVHVSKKSRSGGHQCHPDEAAATLPGLPLSGAGLGSLDPSSLDALLQQHASNGGKAGVDSILGGHHQQAET